MLQHRRFTFVQLDIGGVMKILTLFGGVGAPEKALINLGIPHKQIDYVEIDEKAVRTYNALYHELHKHQAQSVVGWNFKPDILFHGSPCQDFSRAGIRLGGNDEDKTRSSLMWETLKIIENMGVWKPKVVIWENVKGVLDKDMIHSFNKYLHCIEELGYFSSYRILNATDFGIPQRRDRVFVVSTLEGYFNFDLIKKRPKRHVKEFLESEVNDSKYLVTQPSMLNKINTPSNTNTSAFGKRVTIIEDEAWTITTKQIRVPNSGIIDLGNGKYRYLTERECWRLMGFDDEDFEKALSAHPTKKGKMNGTLYKQAGNSIVVQVIEAIFEALFEQGLLHANT